MSTPELKQVAEDIERLNLRLKDNLNMLKQLHRHNKALKEGIKLLKIKRRKLIFGSLSAEVEP